MSLATQLPDAVPAPPPARRPRVDIVVPVHNEQGALPASIRRLHEHLTAHMPFAWRIVIANNASTDATSRVAGRGA